MWRLYLGSGLGLTAGRSEYMFNLRVNLFQKGLDVVSGHIDRTHVLSDHLGNLP